MGGHGGLNILPQKRWNVYNYENREKVRRDEEAAAKEEQLKREQARKHDAEFRLEKLRASRGLAPLNKPPSSEEPSAAAELEPEPEPEPKPGSSNNHINLFEGIKIFDAIKGVENRREEEEEKDSKKKNKRMKKEEVRVVTAEDEKYRLGYGVAGKGVKLPWYLQRLGSDDMSEEREDEDGRKEEGKRNERKKKKTVEELRAERLKREKKEKDRVRALLQEKSRRDGGFSRR